MLASNLRTHFGAVACAAMIAVPALIAQSAQGGRGSGPMYDTHSEVTLTGTVENVQTMAGPGRGGQGTGGTHLILKTAAESLEVHLGPTWFLTERNVSVAKNDALEITGSKITLDDKPVLLARQIKKGEQTVALRDESGRPLWSGRRR